MTSVTLPASAGIVSFKYDPFGRRIEKISPTTTSVFAYDGDNLVETANASGTEVASYTQTQNIDEPLAMDRSGTVDFYEQDGLGSVTSLTNSTGTVTQTYAYDSFGNTTNSSGSLTNFFRYTGREFDTETGLYFYRARYLDTSTGRFLSEDAARFNSGPNFYAYADDEPTLYSDPTGANSTTWPLFWGGIETGVEEGAGWLTKTAGVGVQVALQLTLSAPTTATSNVDEKKDCHRDFCVNRYEAEKDYCNSSHAYGTYANTQCRDRAPERYLACLHNIPYPGPLDPVDWPDGHDGGGPLGAPTPTRQNN
jgi:RHS repeat-associated protein